LDIRQIRYFVAIYEAGSVTKAAARLLVAQSALSQQLAHLEDELGVMLFVRSPQGVAATEFGRIFYGHSLDVLRRISDAIASVRQLAQNPGGIVAVGMLESVSIVLGLPLLQKAKEQFPDIYLRLSEDLSINLKARVKNGSLDLAILYDDGIEDELAAQPLVAEDLYLVSRGGGGRGEVVSVARALSSPLVLPDVRDGLGTIIEKAALASDVTLSNLVSEVDSLTVVKNAVLEGVGSTLLPMSCVAAEVKQGLLCAQPIAHPGIRCTVVLCTRKDALLTHAAASVLRSVATTARELCVDARWVGALRLATD
jgi:LysR family nitrogen assimilation transcriptional regulator